ncbi:MAG: DUF2269 family protein [Chloroflexi bacterium]|nr:DUF2269 family protein [Chloroflexota bacterium]MBA3739553.1 DUF2269 family protein [Chloroflexota bacterium]
MFIHATTILLFFVAHGVSMAVAFALKRETEPARVRALLDLSRFSLGLPVIVLVVVGLLSGILAGFMGGHWGRIWIWASLVIFVVIGGAMTPLASLRLQPIRTAAGMSSSGPRPVEAQPEDPEKMRRLIAAWNPLPIAAMGLIGFIVILWLMLEQPF